MDIDIELEKLIKEYNIDVFDNFISIRDIVNNFISTYSKLGKIGIRCAGKETVNFLEYFGDKINITVIFDKFPECANKELYKYNIPVVSNDKLDEYDLDVIIICTIKNVEEIKNEFKGSNIPNIISLNEELEKILGIKINASIEWMITNSYLNIYFLNYKYMHINDFYTKVQIMKQLIYLYLMNRDICSAQKSIQYYITQDYPDKENYLVFLNKLKKLTESIHTQLKTRGKKDIIVLWQDALNYDHVKYMPFEKECRKKGMYFTNARGTVLWTRGTFRTILDKYLVIDDYNKKVGDNGHKLTKFFIDQGYECKYIGEKRCLDLHTFNLDDNSNKLIDFEPISKVYWNLLKTLLVSSKPLMIVAHSVYETHLPNFTPNLINYKNRESFDLIDENEYIEWEKQVREACKYVDEQTKYLFNLLSKNSIKILMSDHGKFLHKDSRGWDNDCLHINFSVLGNNIPTQVCENMFSLKNFFELSKYILEPTQANFDKIFEKEIPC